MQAIPGYTRSPGQALLVTLVATPLLMASVLPLATGLRGAWLKRYLAIGTLLFATLSLNTVIEVSIFSTLLPDGSLLVSLPDLLPCFLAAAFITGGNKDGAVPAAEAFSARDLAWRLVLAWLSFPVIYFLFGNCVAPFVVPYYEAGVAGFIIPPIDVIMRTQLVRSLVFLAASFPAIALWRQSRGRFIVAMGLLHAMAVGVFGLLQASFMPAALRIAHGLEITADSFAYAAVLAFLLVPKWGRDQPGPRFRE